MRHLNLVKDWLRSHFEPAHLSLCCADDDQIAPCIGMVADGTVGNLTVAQVLTSPRELASWTTEAKVTT